VVQLACSPVDAGNALASVRGSFRDAQAQLGHTKMSTTREIYTLPIPAQQRAAVERLSQSVTNGDELHQFRAELPEPTQQVQ